MFNKFTEWANYKLEESTAESAPKTKMPEKGDIVIKRPSAVFWDDRKPKSSWVKCPSNRNLNNTSMTMYIVIGDQDFGHDGKIPALNTSPAKNRSRKKTWLDPEHLFDITDIYKPEDRKGNNVWLRILPDSKYREIYDFWKQECLEEPIEENENYKRMWKVDLNEQKLYREYPTGG